MLEQVKKIAREAGKRILSFYAGDHGVTYKEDRSPLTLADQASHQAIVEGLQSAWPEIPIISEEGQLPAFEERSTYQQFWLVDPLDGTKEFIKRNGEFTVNIALIENNRPVLGVVSIPVQERLYSAARGLGAFLEVGDAAPVAICSRADFTTDHLSVSVSRSHPSGTLDAFLKKLNGIEHRPLGSSLKFCYIAEGEVDFYPRFGPLMEWDTAAAHVVAEEAGVVITGLNNEPLTYNKPDMRHPHGFIAASNQALSQWLFQRNAAD